MGAVEELYKGRDARERWAAPDERGAAPTLPLLGPAQRELLIQWARSDQAVRHRATLVRLAGASQLELAEDLAYLLMRHGWVRVKERRVHASWQLQAIIWVDLPALQSALGLDSRAQRQTQRTELLDQLVQLAHSHPECQPAVGALTQQVSLPVGRLEERLALLKALVRWKGDQRSGTRRDFALQARQGTKSLSAAEWAWLDEHLDLPALGIERFAPQVWLAGALRLQWEGHQCDLAALHCVGLVAPDLLGLAGATSPAHYWVIENRASFERQAAQREAGVAVIWVPGRPSQSWLSAIGALLDHAPAPALISADPDPAGIEIAMTAAALWQARGLAWQPHQMGVTQLTQAKHTIALDELHDPAVLQRLSDRRDLPHEFVELCDHMRLHGRKAEQEGWL